MRALLVTWDGGSNVQPFEVLAAALCERGDAVTVLSHEAHRSRFEAMGASFTSQPVGEKAHAGRPSESDIRRRVAALWLSDEVAVTVRDLLVRGSFDVALVDASLFNAATACEAAGTPMVVVHHSLPQTMRIARRAGMQAALAPVNVLRESFGLAPLTDVDAIQQHAGAEIAPTFAELDDDLEWAVPIHYVGPLQAIRPEVVLPDLPERFVLVSFSTTWQDQIGALDHVAAGLAGLEVPVVVTVGPAIDPSEVAAQSNTIVLGDVPHTQLFDRVEVVVTHCGHGTTVAALAAGVPLVCMPMGRDQFDIARRVEAVGAGVAVPVDASGDVVAAAVHEVRATIGFQDAARRLASTARAGAAGAVSVVDEVADRD